jgi:hypothetical protein
MKQQKCGFFPSGLDTHIKLYLKMDCRFTLRVWSMTTPVQKLGPGHSYKMVYQAISSSWSAFSGLMLVRPGGLLGLGMHDSNVAADIPSGQ